MSVRTRIRKLEHTLGTGDPLVVVLRSFDDGPVIALRVEGQRFELRAGETRRAAIDRILQDGDFVGTYLTVEEIRSGSGGPEGQTDEVDSR